MLINDFFSFIHSLNSFHLNAHSLGFYPQTRKLQRVLCIPQVLTLVMNMY